ncbi:adenylosuccinase ade13, partial [Ascosphaera acerosa]
MSNHDIYQTPLASRYASAQMKSIFSARTRASTWRQLWIWLAEAQQEVGLPIADEAIAQMKAAAVMTDEDFLEEAEVEKKTRHD